MEMNFGISLGYSVNEKQVRGLCFSIIDEDGQCLGGDFIPFSALAEEIYPFILDKLKEDISRGKLKGL
jgi:hypothetical protein